MKTIYVLALSLMAVAISAQDVNFKKKQIQIIRVPEAPKIDGKLDDAVWLTAPLAENFVQKNPNPGTAPTNKTEVRLLYDDGAIYIGAKMYDAAPDSIRRGLATRDEIGDASYIGIFIDAYQSGIYGESFIVTSAGVQFDAKYSDNGEDENWNAVWKSAVQFTDEGWTAELRIPFSALRFPKKDVQNWWINFQRRDRRLGEETWWSELNPEVSGFFNQFGELKGLKNIDSPTRLFLYPFISGNVSHFPHNEEGANNWSRGFNAGMDIKYGINDAFTLDMTLIPDFGQTASDDQILNLQAFEVQFDENRQFFTEGTELFNKGDLFYSRRIGGTPNGFYDVLNEADDTGETIVSNPQTVQLLNSTKISGRTEKGLGIGIFNSVSAATTATLEDSEGAKREMKTNPLTNYNVLVFDQSLKNNSYVTLVNTNIWREGGGDNYEANVTGSLFSISNKKNTYAISGGAVLSQKYFTNFDNPELGFQTQIEVEKTSGNLNFGIEHSIKSDKYDHNDMGYLQRNNSNDTEGYIFYNIYKPFGRFLDAYIGTSWEYLRLYKPSAFRRFGINPNIGATFKNRMTLGAWMYITPFGSNDYDDPREEGRFYDHPEYIGGGLNWSSDQRKKIYVFAYASGGKVNDNNRWLYSFGIRPFFIISDKWKLDYDFRYRHGNNDTGYVEHIDIDEDGDKDDIIFGRRNINNYENVLNTSYIFNNKMALTLRARHNWSNVVYQSYALLDDEGGLRPTNYNGINGDGEAYNNTNFNAANIDLVYTWEFSPGSQFSVVWKNNIINFDHDTDINFFDNFRQTVTDDQSNFFSIKILYFLDYLSIKGNKSANTTKSVPPRYM